MKAIVYHGNCTLKYEDVPDVFPKAGEVKIKVKATGICGSDLHGYKGLTGRRIPPMIMGHEFAGCIESVGEGVVNFQPGDRVCVYPLDFCGNCEMCAQKQYPLCSNKRQFGVLDVDGAFAQYLCVPQKCCFRLVDSVSYSVGSTMEPLAVALRAVEHAGDLEGKTVFVAGAGTIGLMALACVRSKLPCGSRTPAPVKEAQTALQSREETLCDFEHSKRAGRIIVSDVNDTRLGVAARMGADSTINPTKEDFEAAIKTQTQGKGVDVSIEAVGMTATCQQAMSALKVGGTAVWIGQGMPLVELKMLELVTRELKVLGSFLYGYEEFAAAVAMINSGAVDVTPLISLELPLEKGPEVFDQLARGAGSLVKVILTQ